jgi:hypothetical protein
MTSRIAVWTCGLWLVQSAALAADGIAANRPGPPRPSLADVISRPSPIREASLTTTPAKTLRLETGTTFRLVQDTYRDDRSWIERHPVWTGAIVGFGAGFGLTYLATHDDRDEFIKVMSPGAAGLFWGGVSAGVGALAGWGIGRNHDE